MQKRHGWEFNPARRDLHQGMDMSQNTDAGDNDVLKQTRLYDRNWSGFKRHLGQVLGCFHPLSRGSTNTMAYSEAYSQYWKSLSEEVVYAINGENRLRDLGYNAIYPWFAEKISEKEYL